MKSYLFLIILFVAVPLAAYQVGPANRAKFGSSSQQGVSGEQSNSYRAFTNSNNRWRQGVQTQSVQTSVAGSSPTEFGPVDKKDEPAGKKAAQPASVPNKPEVPASAVSAQLASDAGAMPVNADPTAMLQQVQGMMQGMSGMMGGGSNAQQPAAGQNTTPAIPGMPDMSALMGGMMPTATPAVVPAKK